ncbi:hypothetical protein, partial [Micromonospora sp. DT41]|uniref:hypothetical protein n=1 Tax=Micromonospora sp. DT41 TaxID=3393437 RepID=UPI003CEC16FE
PTASTMNDHTRGAGTPDISRERSRLTDGADSYKGGAYKQSQLTQAISASGAARDPVRVFPIAYGVDAKGEMLEQLGTIASVSGGGSYPAVDRSTIREVLLEVISNF